MRLQVRARVRPKKRSRCRQLEIALQLLDGGFWPVRRLTAAATSALESSLSYTWRMCIIVLEMSLWVVMDMCLAAIWVVGPLVQASVEWADSALAGYQPSFRGTAPAY